MFSGVFGKTGMLTTEPNGVPPTTCPGCDIWLFDGKPYFDEYTP